MARISDKAIELAELLDVAPTAIKENGYGVFSINDEESDHDGEEYLVYDEDEREEALRADFDSLWSDLGIESFSEDFQEWIYENAIDEGFLDAILEEDADYYENDGEENYADTLRDLAQNGSVEDKIQHFFDNYGQKEFINMIAESESFDIDKIYDGMIEFDSKNGYNSYDKLASYDGVEEETANYYVYRIN